MTAITAFATSTRTVLKAVKENAPSSIIADEEDDEIAEVLLPENNETIIVENLPEVQPIIKTKPVLPIIYFSPNTAETIEAEEKVFAEIAIVLKENPEYNIKVEGHANYTINPADTNARLREQNDELIPLSEMRAKAAAENLIKLGIDSRRIQFVGIGGEKPLEAWEDNANWQRNRRVEFVLE
jgi:outer membrane protein OmpA-like peptidoglycan-associated protein